MQLNKSNINTSSSAAATSSSSLFSSRRSNSSSKISHGVRLGLWCFLLLAVILMAFQQPCEGRYLPTRSNGNDLDKLRELMLQILASNDDGQQPANEATGKLTSAQNANWKFAAAHGVYDNGRYF